jgi:hypothetical protein
MEMPVGHFDESTFLSRDLVAVSGGPHCVCRLYDIRLRTQIRGWYILKGELWSQSLWTVRGATMLVLVSCHIRVGDCILHLKELIKVTFLRAKRIILIQWHVEHSVTVELLEVWLRMSSFFSGTQRGEAVRPRPRVGIGPQFLLLFNFLVNIIILLIVKSIYVVPYDSGIE